MLAQGTRLAGAAALSGFDNLRKAEAEREQPDVCLRASDDRGEHPVGYRGAVRVGLGARAAVELGAAPSAWAGYSVLDGERTPALGS